jgi:hypothetical protein
MFGWWLAYTGAGEPEFRRLVSHCSGDEYHLPSSYFPLPVWERNKKVRGLQKRPYKQAMDLGKELRC